MRRWALGKRWRRCWKGLMSRFGGLDLEMWMDCERDDDVTCIAGHVSVYQPLRQLYASTNHPTTDDLATFSEQCLSMGRALILLSIDKQCPHPTSKASCACLNDVGLRQWEFAPHHHHSMNMSITAEFSTPLPIFL